LVIVLVLVIALAAGYRHYGSPATATGDLTLPPPAPAPADGAPTFSADRLGGEGKLALPKRGTHVLVFWSSLNLYSGKSEPYFRDLAEDFGGEGVGFGAVYVNGAPENAASLPYAVVPDRGDRLAGLYNVKRVPRLFLIEDGTVVEVHDGFSPDDYHEVRETLEERAKTAP